ncbi:MAG: MiaB/RimO family radical SAM methylthiotransferase [Candidatus Aminicenantes bacterium]|nr:MiaB/RimO family radical SAM methylthiotransferase [Candidatus Aminicenantes bacterium]
MKFYVNYFGCRTNQAEIQEWIIELENSGYKLVSSVNDADFGIINTCSVTEKAERDVLKFINKVYKNTYKKWIITGCTVSKESPKLNNRYKNYIFINNKQKKDLTQTVKELFPAKSKNLIFHSAFRSRIFLKVQDGCNHRCSFCIVPYLRGKSTSIPLTNILKKVEYFTSLGYREIVLTGINLSAYGYDLFPRDNLLNLIQKVSQVKDIDFLRLSSLDPRYIKYSFIKELSYIENLAQSFHLSLQSGSNTILRKMNRGLKTIEFKNILGQFHKFFPDANFGTDIIVGFPGESEKHFQESVELISQTPLNYLHIFPFSPREGTRAYSLDSIPMNVLKKRMQILKEINIDLRIRYREKFLDRILDGILIQENKNHSLVITGNFLAVRIPPLKGYKKRKVKIRINKMINENLSEGEVIGK